MSELKFTCPSCGQHMQVEKAYVGHVLPCPGCAVELRVPFSDGAGGSPNALPRAQLVLSAATDTKNSANDCAKLAGENPFESTSEIPKTIDVAKEVELKKSAAAAPHTAEVHCLCPVCQSELKIPADAAAKPAAAPQPAELVHKAPGVHAVPPSVPAASPTSLKPAPGAAGLPSSPEREHQIAAAREAQQISVYPAMKPRLSLLLGDDAAPAPQTSAAPSDKPREGEPPSDITTVHE
jgi:hypothetical protein